MICSCSLAGTAACLTCRNRPVLTGNVFREVLGELVLEAETKKAMKIFDALGISLQNEDGTYKSALDVFSEAADKLEGFKRI